MTEAPQSIDEFHARLAQAALPKRLRQCADFVTENLGRIAVLTVAEIAAGADVPPSAVMRFCQTLGFSGFSEMQRLFRSAYSFPDYATRLQNLRAAPHGPAPLLAEFIEAGRLSLEGLAKSLNAAALARAVDTLSRAGVIHVIGLRRAYPVASYLTYLFEKMNIPAVLHAGPAQFGAGDVLIAITFAPYSDEALALARDASAQGLAVIGITDHAAGPMARLSSTALLIDEVDFGAFRSLSATLALTMALAVAVGENRAFPAP